MPNNMTNGSGFARDLPAPYGRCILLKRIAKGGMGEIFLAEQRGAGRFRRDVIVKRLLPEHAENTQFSRMLLEEARIVSRLNHPNIVQVLHCGVVNDHTYLVLEYVNGPSLRTLLGTLAEHEHILSSDVAAYIAMEVLTALSFAHTQVDADDQPMDVVHRDVTPENILLSYQGDVKLTDFGVARAAGRTYQTQEGVIKGKMYYLAPEQIRSQPIDHRLDQYVLGLVLCEMLTGQRVFSGDNEAQLVNEVLDGAEARLLKQPALRSQLGAIAPVVLRALQYHPADRYASCFDMAAALQTLVSPSALRDARLQLQNLLRTYFGAERTAARAERRELAARVDAMDNAARLNGALPQQGDKEARDGDASDVRVERFANGDLDEDDAWGADPDAAADDLTHIDHDARLLKRWQWVVGLTMGLAFILGVGFLNRLAPASTEPPDELGAAAVLSKPSSSSIPVVAGTPGPTPSSAAKVVSALPEPPPAREVAPEMHAGAAVDGAKVRKTASEPGRKRAVVAHSSASAARPAELVHPPPARAESAPHAVETPSSHATTLTGRAGTVDIACLPWCEISINGQPLHQVSPLRNYKILPGEYDVHVMNPPSGQGDTRHLVVHPGEHVQMQFRLGD